MDLDNKLLVKIAQGDIEVTLNDDLLLDLAQQQEINSKTELAEEIKLSRMHLYRLLDGSNVGLSALEKISRVFPQHSDELFFLHHRNIKDTGEVN
ncbi:hypothetical protein Halha_2175 [Halobacteroides halobius DSM 5150]|uniref:Uncharacterized protein n=1 Tax=Halobacteroides halobius (strain ATCC 35273 / DSM 5150 / MD-1) TaxID=748449 RepID=L0K9S1_HALHC|nr:helix-turn-helix domain-containing protein [Halobacteroides halobius]AGB42057.1 hypothetical protein Halha_2175 [Halobacteroides halobius DSM 5150]